MDRCPVAWESGIDDEDGDGEAEHYCGRPDGHEGQWHVCHEHFACAPVCGAPSWFFDD